MNKVYVCVSIGHGGISAEQIIKDIDAIKVDEIPILINSPGGDFLEGLAIYNVIKSTKKKTIAHIEGIAAGIASIIALAADEIYMRREAYLMICEPSIFRPEGEEQQDKDKELITKITDALIDIYVSASKKTKKEIETMMKAETWITADEALEMGFIDAIERY